MYSRFSSSSTHNYQYTHYTVQPAQSKLKQKTTTMIECVLSPDTLNSFNSQLSSKHAMHKHNNVGARKHNHYDVLCCVLCAVCCVLCAVFCVLCSVCCVLCSVFCVLCSVCCVLCAVCCVLCSVFCVLCSVCCVLCSVFCVLCSVCCVLCAVCCVLCAVYIWT